ncbi:hypothetical protein HDC92_000616 [Pedobacter sp. AK017]|uniref:RagB/SusD family nutrient uptake outer membrane protein n=1 Tax=Pedobacter sp. AK017 TaxID=2723073 RepID=UPI00160B0ACC|nr:RagB/SusD family nutrient uptake outer membrane protein [Pedobacter sp. AK017]MBB5436952.1 hypothetical protein [Pedobacter sp. AK017]
MKTKLYYLLIILILVSCKKQDEWLDKKANISDVIPVTLNDMQALLDNDDVLNRQYPALGLIASDNFFVSNSYLAATYTLERTSYKWASDIFEGLTTEGFDWSVCYKQIEYANIVLDGINKVAHSNQNEYDNIKGQALFFRAYSLYHLMQVFGKPYIPGRESVDLGVIVKLSSDINVKAQRSTVQACYDQIIADLKSAETLLPQYALYKTRPSKIAAHAMLSKVYLNMQNYNQAYVYAGLVLAQEHSLLDFNSISKTPTYPFPRFPGVVNSEILFFSSSQTYSMFGLSTMFVDPGLYGLYVANDLRKTLFFRTNADGTYSFRGRYTGTTPLFNGLAINETMLIQAECLARAGSTEAAMTVLNGLLKTRWIKDSNGNSTYVDRMAANAEDALKIILIERRKELPFTGNLRWEDLRRLNQDARFAKTLVRDIAGVSYSLPPNDLRYTYPIPPAEMNVHSVIQNER